MIARTTLWILGSFITAAVPAFGAVPAFAEGPPQAQPVRRLPADGGVPDALLPPMPQPVMTVPTPPADYADRERDAQQLEQFRGGEGVSMYVGGGVLTAVVIVALVVILL